MKSKCLAPVLAVFVTGILLSTASQAAAQVTEQHLQDLIREAAARAGVTQTTATTPTVQTVPGQTDRPVMRLSLDDAIKLALDKNLDISVQRLNPQTFD